MLFFFSILALHFVLTFAKSIHLCSGKQASCCLHVEFEKMSTNKFVLGFVEVVQGKGARQAEQLDLV